MAGFGSGALLFTPAMQQLTQYFAKMPQYLGKMEDNVTRVVDGRFLVEVEGKTLEAMNATSCDLAKLPYDLAEGLYAVGTGSTGVAESLAVMGTVRHASWAHPLSFIAGRFRLFLHNHMIT